MPIYEYHCGRCGEFEAMQRISDKQLTRCPACRGKVTKLISSTSFHLKGSGWYATDYARKQDGADAGGKKSDEKKVDEKKSDEKTSAVKENGGAAASNGGSGEKKSGSDKVAAA
jgi:putative FmdB family regulatory protein